MICGHGTDRMGEERPAAAVQLGLYWATLSTQGFQQKFTFHSKEIVAISCSWCKQAVSGLC